MKITKILPTQLGIIHAFIKTVTRALTKKHRLPKDELYQVKLILDESLTNAMRHGNKLNPQLSVKVTIALLKNRLKINVLDHGHGFNFKRLPDPTKWDQRQMSSGRGIYLIRQSVDHLEFKKNGREICMTKTLAIHPRKGNHQKIFRSKTEAKS